MKNDKKFEIQEIYYKVKGLIIRNVNIYNKYKIIRMSIQPKTDTLLIKKSNFFKIIVVISCLKGILKPNFGQEILILVRINFL